MTTTTVPELQTPCRLKSPLADELLFSSCISREGLSTLGEAELSLLSPKKDIDPDKLLGKPVTLSIAFGDEQATRWLSGYVTRFSQGGFEGRHFAYRMTVRPWLWLLTRTTDCRIFQDQDVPTIVKTVFEDHPVANFEFKLFRSYRKWTYCVQYRETDFDFVARLLEHEGIYWYMVHSDGAHKLVLCDSSSAHDAAPHCESLPFYANAGQVPSGQEYIREWTLSRGIKPGKVVITDYDFERPSSSLLTDHVCSRSYDLSDGEVFDYPGGYIQGTHGKQYVEDRVDEIQSAFEQFNGSCNAQGVCAGHLLKMTRHPRDDQNAQYLVTSTTLQLSQPVHESGDGQATLDCLFSAISARQQYRPPRRTHKPCVAGPQTAVVTGPAGEEIFTDKYGRVKVQFPWDRRGKKNESSSCWISVSHPWAGSNFGGVQIPRIGQEVIIGFLEGDPDRPIIIGRAYNAENMPPWDLPANATQSGMLTRSSKGAGYGNANAIRFEDKKGAEQLWLHAEKNQDIEVENDETHWVGHDRTKTIDRDETTHVKHDRTETVDNNETIGIHGNRTETVDKNETITIHQNRSETVDQNETITIHGGRTETVDKNESITIHGGRTEKVDGNESITIGGARSETVAKDETITINGARTETVAKDETIKINGGRSETVAKNETISINGGRTENVAKDEGITIGGGRTESVAKDEGVSIGGGRTVSVGKDDKLSVGKNLVISAGDSVSITTGSASITMKKDGTITIKGKDITIDGSGKINAKASSDIVMKGSKILQN